jgi:hypothetical protein
MRPMAAISQSFASVAVASVSQARKDLSWAMFGLESIRKPLTSVFCRSQPVNLRTHPGRRVSLLALRTHSPDDDTGGRP